MAVSAPIRIRVQRAPKIRIRTVPRLIPTDGKDGEDGPSNVLTIGTVEGGDTASATLSGTSPAQVLNLVLPKGDPGADGPANTLSIGTVVDGTSAGATITGTSPSQTLNLTLPKGNKGDQGIQGPPGTDGADGAPGVVQALVEGNSVTVDSTDPANPVIAVSIGTTTGTVAAGDDSRITGAAQKDQNLGDLDDAGAALGNLGAGTFGKASFVDATGQTTLNTLVDLNFTRSETGASALPVRTMLEEWPVLPQMFGVEMDASASQVTAFQAMLDAGVKDILIPRGKTIRLDSAVTCDHDVHISGGGTLDFSNGNGRLLIQGAIAKIDGLSANVTKHSKTLAFASDQGLSAGDVLILYNPTDFSFGGRRAYYRDGGMFKVHSTDGNNVLTYDLAVDAYDKDDIDVYKMTPVTATVEGITIIPSTANLAPLSIKYGRDCIIRDVRLGYGGTYCGLEVNRCYNTVVDCAILNNNSPHVNDEYGLIIVNSHYVKVTGAGAYATRHPIAIGGDNDPCSVPCRYINISGMTVMNHPASYTNAGDVHGNGDFVTYSDCVMAGFGQGGRNIKAVGCTIFGMMDGVTYGTCVTSPEVNGGYYAFSNCEFITEGDCSLGVIDIRAIGPSGGGYPAGTHMRENLYLRITNCRITSPNASSVARAVYIQGFNADKNIQVIIDGLEWNAPIGESFLRCGENVNSSFPSDYLIVDNVVGPSGAYLIYPDAKIATVPTREMRQSGTTDVAITASSLVAAGFLDFRYFYSRLPTTGADITSTDGSTLSTVGGKVPLGKTYYVDLKRIRPALQSSDNANFTAGDSVRLCWSAEVRQV